MMSAHQQQDAAGDAPHFYIMDLMSMAFRQFHALSRQDFFTSQGFPTSALYGMTRALFQLYQQEQPTYMVAASDAKAPTFRHKIYPGYKLTRKAMPEELEIQLPKLFELLHLLGIPVITKSGWEADDIIASLAKQYAGKRMPPDEAPLQIRIVSGDKDMMQLVDKHTKLYQTTRGQQVELVGDAEVQDYFGVPPHKVILAQALIGDPTDDIPGVAGIGKTTAAKLLAQVESLDELYAGLEELSSANLKKKLECGRDNAYISEQLVTLATDVAFEFKLEDAAVQPWRWGDANESLNKFLQKCEFRTLRKRYLPNSPLLKTLLPFAAPGAIAYEDEGGEEAAAAAAPSLETPWRCDRQQVQAYLRKVQRYQLCSESSGSFAPGWLATARSAELIFLTAGEHKSPEGARQGVVHLLVVETLAELWQSPSYEVTWPVGDGDSTWLVSLQDMLVNMKMGVAYGSKSLMHQLAAWGLSPREYALTDVQIIEGLVLGREASRSLSEAAQRELGPAYLSLLTDAAELEDETSEHPPLATLILAALYLKWQAPTYRLDEMQYVLWHIETPLSYILFKMERYGVYVDRARLEKFSAWLLAEMEVVSAEVMNLAGETFNIQSPKQLGVILYDKLKLHEQMKVRIKKTKSQGLSTRESALLKLLPHPLVVAVLRYRKLAKLQSTYAAALPEMIHPQTGRVHTSFKQMGTATGRMSSEQPNLQNIPIRTELGKEIRRAFRAPFPSRQMISADYSQIELRVLAHLSQDQNLIAAFKADQDIHQATAAHMLGKPLQQLTSQDRDMAKAINYGIVYGMGARRLAATLGCAVKQASELIDEYYRQFKGVAAYMQDVEQFADQHGYTMTANGRMRIVGGQEKARQGAGVARNSPVQGTAADLMKLAMIRVDQALTAAQLDCVMLLQIHDELLFECAQECVEPAIRLITQEMEAADNFQVPLKVTVGGGEHWLAAH